MFPGYPPPKNELTLPFLLLESLRLVLKQPKEATKRRSTPWSAHLSALWSVRAVALTIRLRPLNESRSASSNYILKHILAL